MNEQQPDGDLYVEIVDARKPIDSSAAGAPPSALASARFPRRRWAIRLSIASLLVLVAAALVRTAGYVAPTAGTATPAQVPPGPVLLLSNVSFGSVTINGRRLDGSPPLVLTFRAGMNVLALAAAPFATQTCRIGWPTAQVTAGNCSTDRSGTTYTVRGKRIVPEALVTLSLGARDLPLSLRKEAGAAVAAAIANDQVSSDVPIGSFIAAGRDAGGQIAWQRTARPMQAELTFAPDTSGDVSSGGLCDSYCSGRIIPEKANVLAGRIWVADADIAVEWQFTSGGALVARSDAYVATAVTVALVYDGARGWQVSQPAMQAIDGFSLAMGLESLTVCAAGANVLAPIAQRTGYGFGIPYDRGVQGCELQLKSLAGTPEGTFIWRFGVLLAVDDLAHALAPALPVAPVDEIAVVSG